MHRKETEVTIFSSNHLDFIPSSLVKGDEQHKVITDAIYVFSHRKNGKHLKKGWNIGAIIQNKKTKHLGFIMADGTSLLADTMLILASVMHQIETGQIKFDFKKGEFINERK